MFRPRGSQLCIFHTKIPDYCFLVAPVRFYGFHLAEVQMLVDFQMSFLCKCNFFGRLLCLFVKIMALFHGCVFWDGSSGVAHFTHWLLFICLRAPEFSGLQCGVLWNSSTVSTEHNVALLTAGAPGAVVGNWVQPKASFTAHTGLRLVYCCSGETDLYILLYVIWNHYVCLNIIILN